MSVPTDLSLGTLVVVISEEFKDSGYSHVGEIVELCPKQNGYKVRPLGELEPIKFGWGYKELRMPTQSEIYRPSFFERLFERFI